MSANCFHPGVVATGLARNNGALARAATTIAKPFLRSPAKGAETLVWLLDSPAVSDQSGGYFVDCRRTAPSARAQDLDAARRLWTLGGDADPRASLPERGVRSPGRSVRALHRARPGESSFSPRKKRESLGHNYIGSEHLLLGLLREEEGLARRGCSSTSTSRPSAFARRSSGSSTAARG